MIDCHLIVFFDNQNLGIDTRIGFLSNFQNYWISNISVIMLFYAN